jgi:hypothetical protein
MNVHGVGDTMNEYKQQYGRIHVQTDSGSVSHQYDSELILVNHEEVLLNISLTTATNILTLYAVRRFKIQSYEVHSSVVLTPMQPSIQRNNSNSLVDDFFANKTKPLDFSCTELDLSTLSSGAKRALPNFLFCLKPSLRLSCGVNIALLRRSC